MANYYATSPSQYGAGSTVSALQDMLYSALPAIWTGDDYAPDQWAQWHEDRSPQARQLKRTYTDRALPVLERYWSEYIAQQPEDLRAQVRSMYPGVVRLILNTKAGAVPEEAKEVRTDFLNWMQATALGGSEAEDTSVTPEQFSKWRSAVLEGWTIKDAIDSLDADFRLTPTGQQMMRRLVDYNLLRAFQTDPIHRPPHLQTAGMGALQSAIGIPWEKAFGPEQPVGQWNPLNNMAATQFGNTFTATPAAAARNTLMWDDWGRKKLQDDPEFFNRRFTGAAVPQASALTAGGLDMKSSGGETQLAQSTRYLQNYMLHPNTAPDERQAMNQMLNEQFRFTPIRRTTGVESYRDDRRLTDRLGNLEAEGQKMLSTYGPKWARAFNRVSKGIQLPTSIPPALVNDAFMVIPNILGDPQNLVQTLVTLGGGLFAGGLRGAGRAAVQVGKQWATEAPGEAGFNTGVSVSNSPQSWKDYMTKPDPGVPLRVPGTDRIPDGENQDEYNAALRQYESDRKNLLGQAKKALQNQQRAAPKPKSRAPGFDFPVINPFMQ